MNKAQRKKKLQNYCSPANNDDDGDDRGGNGIRITILRVSIMQLVEELLSVFAALCVCVCLRRAWRYHPALLQSETSSTVIGNQQNISASTQRIVLNTFGFFCSFMRCQTHN